MIPRTLVVVACSASAVVVAVALTRRGDETASEQTAPQTVVVSPGTARAPEFPPVRSDQERLVYWLRILETGAESDVTWAQSRLRLAGPGGRRVLREAAQVALESNAALVEQALEFLVVGAESADAPLALGALKIPDPQAVLLAMHVLAAAPGADRDQAARAVGQAAAAGDVKVRLEGVAALQKIGGDVAAAEAVRLAQGAPADMAAGVHRALAGFRHEAVHAALLAAFADQTDLPVRFASASALVEAGDSTPAPWLESIVAAPPKSPIDYADAALDALSTARRPGVLAKIGAAAADGMEDTGVRVAMIDRLARYPLDSVRKFLDVAAADVPGNADEVRVQALEALIRLGADDVVAATTRLASSDDKRSAWIAALVFGRVRRPDAARALLEASRRPACDDRTRAMLLRAVVLSGAPDTAVDVVSVVAQDHSPLDARFTVAGSVGSMLDASPPEFRKAVGAAVVRGLRGEFGPVSGAGLVELLREAVLCCGEEASAAAAASLSHPDAAVRAAAATTLGYVADADAERELRAAWWRWSDVPSRSSIETAMERAHFRHVVSR